jgi:hypothetical protein
MAEQTRTRMCKSEVKPLWTRVSAIARNPITRDAKAQEGCWGSVTAWRLQLAQRLFAKPPSPIVALSPEPAMARSPA